MTDFAATRALFDLPEGVIYLDGNSLGPMPKAAAARVSRTITEEWGEMLITGWNTAGWMDQPARVGDRIARLIGAAPGTVVMGDTLSIKVYQALASALELNPTRRVILSDTGNFPSDLYMADGLVRTLGRGYVLKTVAPEDVDAAIDDSVAVTLITEVDYRTGRRHDMAGLTAKAHAAGALAIWDLAHSAGALPVDLAGDRRRFRGRLHLQIPQLRPRRPGLHLRRPAPCRKRPPGAFRLARPRGPLRLRPRLPARPRHRADARRHPAGAATRGAGSRARHLGHGRHGRGARGLASASPSRSSPGSRPPAPPSSSPPPATRARAAARSASATRTATPSCRR